MKSAWSLCFSVPVVCMDNLLCLFVANIMFVSAYPNLDEDGMNVCGDVYSVAGGVEGR